LYIFKLIVYYGSIKYKLTRANHKLFVKFSRSNVDILLCWIPKNYWIGAKVLADFLQFFLLR